MRQLRADEGGRPWVIQPELVTGCSMRFGSGSGGLCHFCGLNAIRSGPGNYEYMSDGTVEKIVEQMVDFCPTARVEFAMRGEPLIHPKARDIVAHFRDRLPKASLMLTTNGDVLRGHLQERVTQLFDAGLNLLLLDTYYPKERRDALREEALAFVGAEVVDFFRDWAGRGRSPYSNQRGKKILCVMDDLSVHDGEHGSRLVKTHAGANPTSQIPESLRRTCSRPFRELVIHSDGSVPLCCDDWRQEFVIGNVCEMTLREIWRHPRMEAARARLYQADRAFGICASCDAPSAPRFGLLPVYSSPTNEQVMLTEGTFRKKLPLWKEKS